MNDEPTISGLPEGDSVDELIQKDKSTADWMMKQCNQEMESFKAKGMFLIPVKVLIHISCSNSNSI